MAASSNSLGMEDVYKRQGLGALLGDAVEQEESRPQPQEREADEVRMLPVRLIDPNREQPRRSFDEQALADLAQ